MCFYSFGGKEDSLDEAIFFGITRMQYKQEGKWRFWDRERFKNIFHVNSSEIKKNEFNSNHAFVETNDVTKPNHSCI